MRNFTNFVSIIFALWIINPSSGQFEVVQPHPADEELELIFSTIFKPAVNSFDYAECMNEYNAAASQASNKDDISLALGCGVYCFHRKTNIIQIPYKLDAYKFESVYSQFLARMDFNDKQIVRECIVTRSDSFYRNISSIIALGSVLDAATEKMVTCTFGLLNLVCLSPRDNTAQNFS